MAEKYRKNYAPTTSQMINKQTDPLARGQKSPVMAIQATAPSKSAVIQFATLSKLATTTSPKNFDGPYPLTSAFQYQDKARAKVKVGGQQSVATVLLGSSFAGQTPNQEEMHQQITMPLRPSSSFQSLQSGGQNCTSDKRKSRNGCAQQHTFQSTSSKVS